MRPKPLELSMQPVPGCRIRVWKKEWQQTVGSQTSLTTGTRRIGMSRGQGRGEKKRKEGQSNRKRRLEKSKRGKRMSED